MSRTVTGSTPGAPGAGFEERMVAWLNRRFGRPGVTIAADTPLFAGRLIDSIRILELIAWTERAIGREIPDADIRMDNFRSVARIAEVFASSAGRGTAEGGRTASHHGSDQDQRTGIDDVAVEGGVE